MKSLLHRVLGCFVLAAAIFSAQATEVSFTANVLRVHPLADGSIVLALRTT